MSCYNKVNNNKINIFQVDFQYNNLLVKGKVYKSNMFKLAFSYINKQRGLTIAVLSSIALMVMLILSSMIFLSYLVK